MCKVDRRSFLPFAIATLALAIGAAYSSAHAAVDSAQQHAAAPVIDPAASASTRSDMAACKTLPLSERDMCAAQAGYGQAVTRDSLSPAQRQALAQEDARYKAALAACNRMPVSDRTMCVSQSGTAATLIATK